MQIRDVMTPQVEFVNPDITLKEAANKMKNLDIGVLPVGENDRLVGMLTDRDMIIRGIAEGKDPNKLTVREAMTPEVVYCYEDDDIRDAAKLMKEKKIRRLNILNRDKRLVGICSLGDLTAKTGDVETGGEVLVDISKN